LPENLVSMHSGKGRNKNMLYIKRKSIGSIVFDIFNYMFMIIFAFTIVYPFWNMFLLSFRDTQEAISLGFHFWNKNWYTTSYEYIFENSKILVAYRNTIIRTITGTFLTIFISIMGAYSLSKKNLPGRNIITIYYLIPMFFGGGLIPTYMLIRSLGLMNSLWALILPGIVSSFNLIMMRNFIMTIDKEMEESAFIDGASYIMILWKIIMPLSKPVIATITLWTAVYHWNAWFDALIYIRDEKKIVLQLLLRRMIQMTSIDMQTMLDRLMEQSLKVHTSSVIAATTIITIGPIIMIYPFLQRYFVKGIMVGSLKG